MENEVKESSALNIVIPLVVMVATVLIYDNDLVHGIFACIVAQLVLYVGGKVMDLTKFVDSFYEGAKSMCSMAILVCFSFTLSAANEAMLYVLYDDGARASGEVSGTLSIPMTKGSIIYEVLDQYDVVSIEPRLEDYEFEGWLEYRVYPEDPEDPMTHYIQEEVSDKVYTTQVFF